MAKGVVKGSKVVSIRKAPWDPMCDETIKEVKKGDTVVVDPNHTVYDWKGHEYYPFVSNRIQNGYIRKDAVRITRREDNYGRTYTRVNRKHTADR